MRRRFLLSSSAQEFPNVPIPNQVTSRATFMPYTVGGNDWQGRANPIINALGEWVLIWLEGVMHSDPSATTARMNIAFSDDEGATWSDNNEDLLGNPVTLFPLFPTTSPATFIGDFNLIRCPNDDLVLICQERGSATGTWNNSNVTQYQYRSTDNGKTWATDFDFSAHIGLTGDDKARVQGLYENMVVGSTIYIIFAYIRTDLDDTRIELWKSTDNCTNWSKVSNPVEYDEADPDCTESSIGDLGSGIFFCVFRTQHLGQAVWKRSEDFGLTWGALTEFSSVLGNVGIHQPRVQRFANFFLLMGRDSKQNILDPDTFYSCRSAFWTTTDLFVTARRQYLDPFYAGVGDITNLVSGGADAGYSRALLKADGSFTFFGYWGTNQAAAMYTYTASHTPTPSNEDYSNIAFLPETITVNGIRLQLNRDNCTISTGASPTVGIGVISRAHNGLSTSDRVWSTGGTVTPELIIASNKGWAVFSNGRILSASAFPNLIFKASFSVSFFLDPDDGQPAATGIIMWNNSTTSATLAHGIQCNLGNTGKILFRYAVAGTLVSALTNTAVFADGAVDPKHIAITVTSADLIRIYVDGVLQTLDAGSLGDMSTVTMASFSSALPLYIGQRNNAGTFDLPYIGKIRELTIQPVVWDTTNISNLMLN